MPPPHRPRRRPPVRSMIHTLTRVTMDTISALPNLVSLSPPPTPNELKAQRRAFFDLPIETLHHNAPQTPGAEDRSNSLDLLGTKGHGLTNVEIRYTLSCIYKSSVTLSNFRGFLSFSTRPSRHRLLRLFQFPARGARRNPSLRRLIPRYEDPIDAVHDFDRRRESPAGLDQHTWIDLSH